MIDHEKNLLDAALSYAERGFAVLPLHSIHLGALCTCGSATCKSAGKHPRTTNGVKDASTNSAMNCYPKHFTR